MSQETETDEIPSVLWRNAKINGKTWVAGFGKKPADVMFVSPVISEEEAAEQVRVGFDRYMPRTPRHTDNGQWQILKTWALAAGVDIDDCYVTSLVKYLPDDRRHRTRPLKTMVEAGMEIFRNEVRKVKPKIIVCLGKLVFDLIHSERLKESDIYGAWIYSKEFNCLLYPMLHISQALKPEKKERWMMDFRALRRQLDALSTSALPEKEEREYIVIHNSSELIDLVMRLEKENATLLSVDCEWHGSQHVDGKLRSLQICWAKGKAAYIRFMDDQLNYAFDVSYKEAGKILGLWVDRPDVKYIGHHLSVDLTWMSYWLGVQWYGKGVFDSEFVTQCCDEAADLGLDALALRYTTFGKYDLDLIRWKKANPHKADDGYGLIPDEILIPYALKDVDTVMHSYEPLTAWMEKQGLTKYYNEICNPFAVDVFTYWCLKGIPVDKGKLDEMRDLYNWAKGEMDKDFRSAIVVEAKELLRDKLEKAGQAAEKAAEIVNVVCDLVFNDDRASYTALCPGNEEAGLGNVDTARSLLKRMAGAKGWTSVAPAFDHLLQSPSFNIRSNLHMIRWLFDVKGYTPVKSTKNAAEGIPSVDWQKILAYPPEKQATFTPAVDKGTLEILARRYDDKLLDQLLEFNAVGNLCKAFLKPADIDPETGEQVKENGIAYWLASDGKIHLNHSTTETGRPRSWNPNILNWPSLW